MSVIDLGGTADAWLRAPVRPAHVHLVNLESPPAVLPEWMETDRADACELPDSILGGPYDLVISNSVLEHVGGHERRQRFADAVHRLADRHWIQTPYRYFPVEPHWLFPGFQFLPAAARTVVARHWPLVHTPPADRATALRTALSVELVSRTELAFYFPGSQIRAERMAGLVKSLIAVKA
ncbi:class I SAM-dependent methyltransferase [Actinoallomurus purpureus]|uniref:class I SAM-dependent methyltransferase n=1 Tax=Actinoallomurus purpureus TaxID=478114 RepID=UPI0020933D14|nr:class I SAM-dependent methyltransferase [Actinoallomurus purpureus]MCO6009553.1 class I SAM-dependent methyltransferase [Actinoallomurus purpureus]